ncbi:efflux RND transporter periplasmic adaptor subunit [Lignipirellula cremea]|nr:efflux RND transporter periplasmic adaptor subunit [Lignipirellula cremea]
MSTETEDAVIRGEETEGSGQEPVVRLSEGKRRTAAIQSTGVSPRMIQHVHEAPGRIGYNESQHIEIKSPVSGILTEVLVKPGDQVAAGDLLAVISSAEVGGSRAEVLQRQAELRLSQRRLDREALLRKNLHDFLTGLDQESSIDVLEKAFAQRPLGDYRQRLLSARSRFQLADDLYANLRTLGDNGSVAGKTVRERGSNYEVARAEYRSVREAVAFEAELAEMEAQAAVDDAQRRVRIAQRQMTTLLGLQDSTAAGENDASLVSESLVEDAENTTLLSRLEIRAPFAGTIEMRTLAANERVTASATMFVLANTSTLYVSADIRENDWAAMSLQPGAPVKVLIPAIPDQEFTAIVHYVGREVSRTTNSLPLVAGIDNAAGLLRPGMFVRVSLPIGPPQESLAVHAAAVVHNEEEQFVFVQLDEGAFRKVDVTTGNSADDWIEITHGLTAGERVVDQGAFLLKSELLLTGETD